jgi:uncharacterized protein (TIGR03083 family)
VVNHEQTSPPQVSLHLMDWSTYLQAIRRESDALSEAGRLGLEPAVPSCPGWTVRDVVEHTGLVHRHKERIVRERWIDSAPEPHKPDPPTTGLIDWFENGVHELLETLAANDPNLPVFSWYPSDQSVGFWYRRMAHETAIHRIDAELGHDIVRSIDPPLAADGIDEILTVMMEGFPDWASSNTTRDTLRVECTDRPGSWSVRFITWSGVGPESGTDYRDEPGILFEEIEAATTTLSGPASDLDLFLWGRGPKERLSIHGEAALVDRLRGIAREATQ